MNKKMGFVATVLAMMIYLCVPIWAADVQIQITAPSEAEKTIAPGRSFYVMGTFDNGEQLQDNDEVAVEILDSAKKTVRRISSTIMDNHNMYIEYPGLSYYGDNKNELLDVGMPDLIWDGKDENTFHDGDRKLFYNSKEFAALIPGGNGEIDDGMNLLDSNGKAYDTLPKGEYTVHVTIKRNGKQLGTAQQNLTIGVSDGKILSRFSPKEHMDKVQVFAKQNDYRVYLDKFPGYWSKGDIFCEILPSWRAADATEYVEGQVHFVIYNVKESSATYSVELAELEKKRLIDDQDGIHYYYYDYGEVTLPDDNKTESEIVPFETGDKLQLVRAETIITDTKDNVYLQDDPQAVTYDLNLKDGALAEPGETLAIYGVTAPIQIDEKDIVDQGDNSYQLKNRIKTIVYKISGDGMEREYEKEVNLDRVSGEWDNYSIFEFKHDIPIENEMSGKKLRVELIGKDCYGAEIAGSEETFDITVGKSSIGVPPETGEGMQEMMYVILLIAGCVGLVVSMEVIHGIN